MRGMEPALHYFVDPNAEVLGGGDLLGKFFQGIQVFVVESRENFFLHEVVEIRKVAYHASLWLDLPADRDFHGVVVTVAIWVIAFAVGRLVLLWGHGFAVQAVGGGEQVTTREMGFHGSGLRRSKAFSRGDRGERPRRSQKKAELLVVVVFIAHHKSRRRGLGFHRPARDGAWRVPILRRGAARWQWRCFRWWEFDRGIRELLY